MNKTILLAALTASAAFADDDAGQFEAARVAHSGTVHVNATPEQAFQLFTPPGEKLWVKGWDPVVLSGGDGRDKGAVFVTTHHQEQTIWVVIDYQPESLHARYARVAPASRAGTVEVLVRPDGEGGAEVDVIYELTALNKAGNRDLADFDADRFSNMITEWEQAIRLAKIDYPSAF